MNDSFFDKLSTLYFKINKLFTWLIVLYVVGAGIYKGVTSITTTDLITSIAAGVIGGIFVLLTSYARDIGLNILDKSTDWLSSHIRKFPFARLWVIIPGILFAYYSAYLIIRFLQTEFSLRVFIGLYLIWVLPAALLSLIRDDLTKERTRLSKKVSREIRIENPQAAIENAYTHFEDYLRNRISGDAKLTGNRLISAAFGGEKSKLVFRSDGKDYTAHLYNLMSGAFSIFRNPRHHKIIEDGEQKAHSIISLAELLIESVDLAEHREIDQEKESSVNMAV